MCVEFLKELNDVQRQAAAQLEGPVMIVAGAGSGKTRVLTYRIAYILSLGNDPYRVLALTFTNKAAREMRERIEKLVGNQARSLWMGTFHSIFARVLRAEADKLGYPSNFSIYDTDDAKSLLKAIVKEKGLDDKLYKINLVYSRISSLKNSLIGPAQYQDFPELVAQDITSGRGKMGEIYTEYQTRLFKSGAMDFDDLLFKTFQLFTNFPDVLYKYQNRFHFIMVDEYQDTNLAQYRIIKMLAAIHQNLCVVGDDAQSIYGFRGADISNILNYEKDYPGHATFKLEQNYRSTKTIVSAASDVIKQNQKQLKKEIWTANEPGDLISVTKLISDTEEGKLVAATIFEDKMKNQLHNSDFAILYRTNSQSRAIEESLRKLNIPYRIYGGVSFYQRKEVKDLISYLRLISNPNDEEALKRIINYPTRGIGDKSVQKLIVLADQFQKPLWEIVANIEQTGFGTGANKIADFGTLISSFMAQAKNRNAFELAELVAKESGVLADLYNDKTVEGLARYQNIEELLNGIREFVEDEANEDKSLAAFLQNVSLLTTTDQKDEDGNDDKVSLMTVHMAKGLEFPYVFIVGMEDGLFPSMMSMNSRSEIEEERRLFYVAITRAEKRLRISFAVNRFKNGQLMTSEPSRFLGEINPAYLKIEGQVSSKPVYGPSTGATSNRPIYGPKAEAFTPIGRGTFAPKAKPTFAPKPTTGSSTPEDFIPSNPNDIREGQRVLHARFGNGTVEKIDREGSDAKASIRFNDGVKQLVLKFARLKILD